MSNKGTFEHILKMHVDHIPNVGNLKFDTYRESELLSTPVGSSWPDEHRAYHSIGSVRTKIPHEHGSTT